MVKTSSFLVMFIRGDGMVNQRKY